MDSPLVPTGQIEWLVARIHVGTPRAAVVRDFVRRMRRKDGVRGYAFSKPFRKGCYRAALAAHEANRQLCRDFRL